MTKAIWNDLIIAESDDIAHVESTAYFPKAAVNWDCLLQSPDTLPTYCHWKGMAHYFDIIAGGAENKAAAWWYPEPYDQASVIRDHVAFWNGVEILDAPDGSGLVERQPSVIHDRSGWQALCWQLKFAEDAQLSRDQVAQRTDIPVLEVDAAWSVYDVQRYARQYKWQLHDSAASGTAPWIERFD